MTSILALDCSTHVGHAFFADVGAKPILGTWKAPKSWSMEDYGKRFHAFHNWLTDMLTTFNPDILAFEGPVMMRGPNANTTEHTIRTLIGLVSVAELVAALRGIRCFEVNVATAKKELSGNGRAKKDEMIIAATRRGYEVANDHEADAIAVALVVFGMLEEGDDNV